MNLTSMTRAAAAPLLALALGATGCHETGATCESSALCRDGDFCFEGRCVSSLPAGTCAPPTAGTLTTGTIFPPAPTTTCNPTLSSTWPSPKAPQASGWETHLGEVAAGATVAFDVPPGTSSLTIHQQGVTAAASFQWPYYGTYYEIPNSCVPTAVRAPNGGAIYEDDFVATLTSSARDPSLRPASYLGITQWSGSFTVPATSRLLDLALAKGALPAGTWSIQVGDWNEECRHVSGCQPSTSGVYDVSVIARPGPFRSTGTLDVAIYLVGGSVSAASAASSPAYRRFVATIGEILGRGGICLGTVTFFDVPAWVQNAYGTVRVCDSGPCSDLGQLFSLASPSVDGVHLFLVDVLDGSACSTGGGTIVGIDGSIPGPSGLAGTVNSGAAMADNRITLEVMDDLGSVVPGTCGPSFDVHCRADFSAYIAAHEIGHWLGLYHTTEHTGQQFDPLGDTGTCECGKCGGTRCGQSAMAPSGCSSSGPTCAGGDNLMFWVIDLPWSRGNFSSEQGIVMRVNPAVK